MKNIRQKIFEKCFFYEKRHCLTQIKVFFFLLLFGNISLMAQNFVVNGKVLDANNEPLIGAAVVLKSQSTVGTVADFDGNFTLEVPDKNAVLTVSYLGMTPQDVNVNGRSMIVVVLREDSEMLEEVVVVGYGQQKKASVVGAITQTKGEVLERSGGVTDIGAALTGNLPGVITTQSSGMPGEEEPEIVIRGASSWNNSSPLVLVDGIERPMSSVDISSVQSISVLKDASATAVYGVKGANGVILITTKRGQEGKAQIDVSAQATMKVPSKLPSKLDSYDALTARNFVVEHELALDPNAWDYITPQAIINKYRYPVSLAEAERYPNVDWQDALFENYAMSYNANLNVSGGTKFVKYFVSADFVNEGDLFKIYDNGRGYKSGYGYNRINVRSNLDFQLTKTTLLKINLAGSNGIRTAPWGQGDSSSWSAAQFWAGAYGIAPDVFMPVYSDGTWGYYPNVSNISNSAAILALAGNEKTTTTRINTDFTLEQDLSFITKGLSLRGMVSWDNVFVESGRGINDLNNSPQYKWIDPADGTTYYKSGYDTNNKFDFQDNILWQTAAGSVNNSATQRNLNYQIQLNWARDFEKHNVTAMGLFSRQETALGSVIPSYREDWAFRTTYNYANKYFVEYNGAYNGSEKFAPEYRFAFFNSGAIGWMLSEEKFMSFTKKWLDMLKIRASYGEIGDDNVADRWLYMSHWALGNGEGGGYSLMDLNANASSFQWYRETAMGNPDIHWETVKKFNLGIDYSFLGGLLAGTVEVFRDRRTDIIVNGGERAVLPILGIDAPSANLGEVKTKGYELELRVNKVFENKMRLWGNFNMTHAKNEVIERDDPEMTPAYQKQAGFSIKQSHSHIDKGYLENYDQIYGAPIHSTNDGQMLPGDYYIVDFNADGVIDDKDGAPYGYSPTPQNTYNATIGFEWKGFSAFIQFYGVNNVTRDVTLTSFVNKTNIVYDNGTWWSKDTPNADRTMPRFMTTPSYNTGTQYLYDGSYIRLKNAEIAYTFDSGWVRKIGIRNLKVFLNGNNLWLWTRMPDDRESNFAGASNQGSYPTMKRINLGLKFTL